MEPLEQVATEESVAEPQGAVRKDLRAAAIGFAAVSALGVVICVAYLSVRAANAPGVKAAQTQAEPAAVTTPAKQATAAVAPKQAKPGAGPRPGESYLQVGAIAPEALKGFLEALEAKGFHPLVAPGPDDGTRRVLIGPLHGDELTSDAAKLTAAGFEWFRRDY